MAERFGELLRELRRQANKTLGDVARMLGVSVVYVSDVERGNRKPFSTERLIEIAKYLGTDPLPLIEAADREKGTIEYDITNARPLEVEVVGSLVAGLHRGGVSEEQLRNIQTILNSRRGEDDE